MARKQYVRLHHPKMHIHSKFGIPTSKNISSDFIWEFGKLPFPTCTHLGKYLIKIGKIRAKIHEIGKIKAIFGLGMTPIYGLKNGQIKSLIRDMLRTQKFLKLGQRSRSQ